MTTYTILTTYNPMGKRTEKELVLTTPEAAQFVADLLHQAKWKFKIIAEQEAT